MIFASSTGVSLRQSATGTQVKGAALPPPAQHTAYPMALQGQEMGGIFLSTRLRERERDLKMLHEGL